MNVSPWCWVFLPWAAWIVIGVVSVIQVRKLRVAWERWPGTVAKRWHRDPPPVTLIVPFKGIDLDLEACVKTLCTQDYPDYRLVCVVESEEDPAYPVLREALAGHPERRTDLWVAGEAGPDVGQKVHNQLHAIRRLEPEADDREVWAFADSDAVPGAGWLDDLVRPLQQPRLNPVTSGYRWLVPAEGAGFFATVASVINGSVACGYRRDTYSPAWGGAMAMPVAVAREGDLVGHLTGALTDDYPITKMAAALGGRVRFVPRCLSPTPVDFDRAGFWRFARRQYLITRIYMPRLFLMSLAVLTGWWLGALSGWGGLALGLAGVGPPWLAPAAAAVLVAMFVLHQWRASQRRRLVETVFEAPVVERLRPALAMDRWLTPLWMAIHLAVVITACGGRTIRWRGFVYRLEGPQRVRRG